MAKKAKKALSLMLALLLVLSLVPMGALASEEAADEVIYNLGRQEITVGNDTALAEEAEGCYVLFDESGAYTIMLEENAFFPYEVQFQADGKTFTEWFETADSTVDIAGHTFSVYSERSDDTKLAQIGVWIEGEYVAAYPEAKEFTNSDLELLSLLPLKEVMVNLDLKAYNFFQFSNISVAAMLSGLDPAQTIGSDAKVVWAHLNSDDYDIVEQVDKIDLSYAVSRSNIPFRLELIVGSALQLDDSNTRYIVKVETNVSPVVTDFGVYTEQAGVRSVAAFHETDSTIDMRYSYFEYCLPSDAVAQTYYLGVEIPAAYGAFKVKALEGLYDSIDDALAAVSEKPSLDVTARLVNQTLTNTETGYEFLYDPVDGSDWENFTLLFFDGDSAVGFFELELYFTTLSTGVSFSKLYDDANTDVVQSGSTSTVNDAQVRTNILYSQYQADKEYYSRLLYRKNGTASTINRTYVDKAVVGHCDSLEAAASLEDIKDDLFPETFAAGAGHLANYSGNGQDFTIFAEGKVYKITIKAVDGQDEPPVITSASPNPGSPDTYFRVTGAAELSNTYVLPYEHDTYYDMGYQTVFYTDAVNLNTLKPTFEGPQKANVYAGHSGSSGALQASGKTVQDFSKGPVQYSVPAEDGTSLKNYWVTFVQKHTGGAKLFVNGINGADGAVREVFFTSINSSSNVHDIFLANVGDAELTGLKATLTNAQNIRLDAYWTVGGTDNNTLAAFDDNTTLTSNYAELANVAKIRLLPDGEGEISGTLTISAAGHEDVVITLTGYAGDPKLTTLEIPNAVKYVPYAAQILHNNKYSWNKVTMVVTSGSLPKGVTLRPNGELYGVPTEVGTFRFRVQMSNSDPRFYSNSRSYTLVVRDNTDANVAWASDHDISTRVPATITSYQARVFEVENGYADFMDFYLDGRKLEDGVDYDSEEGSTKITIRAQTLEEAGKGTHTIAAEFREDADLEKEMTKAAQNYTANVGKDGNPVNPGTQRPSGTTKKPSSSSSPAQPVAPVPEVTGLPFTDLFNSDWHLQAVKFCYAKGLLIGISPTEFAPNMPISRSMMITVLYRIAGQPAHNGSQFADLSADAWYADAVSWAVEAGIATGIGDNLFAPDAEMTREQMAVMMYNFCTYIGIELPEVSDLELADADKVSSWALEAVQAMYRAGVLTGKGDGVFDPGSTATRAEVAALLERFMTILEAQTSQQESDDDSASPTE